MAGIDSRGTEEGKSERAKKKKKPTLQRLYRKGVNRDNL